MITVNLLPDEINSSPLTRPSGLVAASTRWRKSWMYSASVEFIEKVQLFDRDVRFTLYRELDIEVHKQYMNLLAANSITPDKSDIDDLMIEAGTFVASQLN